jgi:anti-sigma B factor antagonist
MFGPRWRLARRARRSAADVVIPGTDNTGAFARTRYNPPCGMKRTLQISDRVVDGVAILDMQGRLVLDEVDLFRRRVEELIRQQRLQIVLNLEGVTYIDSAGVGMMVGKYLSVRRLGGDIKLLHLSPRSQRVMTITKLLTVFEAFDSEEKAVASFASARR